MHHLGALGVQIGTAGKSRLHSSFTTCGTYVELTLELVSISKIEPDEEDKINYEGQKHGVYIKMMAITQ